MKTIINKISGERRIVLAWNSALFALLAHPLHHTLISSVTCTWGIVVFTQRPNQNNKIWAMFGMQVLLLFPCKSLLLTDYAPFVLVEVILVVFLGHSGREQSVSFRHYTHSKTHIYKYKHEWMKDNTFTRRHSSQADVNGFSMFSCMRGFGKVKLVWPARQNQNACVRWVHITEPVV